MSFEFDPAKDAINRDKHGLSLLFAARIFDAPDLFVLPSPRPIDGEFRYKAIGSVNGRLHTAVYVHRGDNIRLISVRRSNAGEQRDHDRHSGGSE